MEMTMSSAKFWAALTKEQLLCLGGNPVGTNHYYCKKTMLIKLEDLLIGENRLQSLRGLLNFAGVNVTDERIECVSMAKRAARRGRSGM